MKHLFLTAVLIIMGTSAAYANSSWHWISETRPYDLLPIVIVVTIGIETWMINRLGKINNVKKVALWVVIANIVSFVAPYLLAGDVIYTMEQRWEHSPFYTIGIGYFFFTIAFELPIMYKVFAEKTEDESKFINCVLLANAITTIFTAVVERLICYGVW